MRDKSLLVCIPFHYNPERIQYLEKVIARLRGYDMKVCIRIDTNKEGLEDEIIGWDEMSFHNNLSHPFYLTWMNRLYIKNNIKEFDYFMYIEDDMDLPFENFLMYLENFNLLWPSFVPSFIRVEKADGKEFVTDAKEPQSNYTILDIAGKQFVNLSNPYHAFWIMPQKELEETMIDNFVRVHESREHAASYPMWELHKTPLVMIENGQVSTKCYSYHLPNGYALSKESEFGKVETNKLLI